MAESIIKVIVSDQVGKKSKKVKTGKITEKNQAEGQNDSDENNAFSKRMMGVYHIAKTVSNQILANVGTYTGDSRLQTKVNNMQTGVGLAFIAKNNPQAAVMSMAISFTSTIWNENRRRKMEDINLANQRAKNGYSDSASILTSRRH